MRTTRLQPAFARRSSLLKVLPSLVFLSWLACIGGGAYARSDEQGGSIEIDADGVRVGKDVLLTWSWNPAVDPGPGFVYQVRRKIYGVESFQTIALIRRDGRSLYRFRDVVDPDLPYRYKILVSRIDLREYKSRPITLSAQRLQVTGPSAVVFDRSRDARCGSDRHFADGPARVVRIGDRRLLLMPNMETFAGVSLDKDRRFNPGRPADRPFYRLFQGFPCVPIFTSTYVPEIPMCPEDPYIGDVDLFQNMEWLWSVWVDPDVPSRIFGLVHNEYHECPDFKDDQYDSISAVVSEDGGRFRPIDEPPFHTVATPPYRYDPDYDSRTGYSAPTNIVRGRNPDGSYDGFYYAFFSASEYDPDGNGPRKPIQQPGTCLMRTRSLDPGNLEYGWEFYIGDSELGVADFRPFVNPYLEDVANPRRFAPKPISTFELGTMHSSVYYSEQLGEYVFVGAADGLYTGDKNAAEQRIVKIYYAISKNKSLWGEWTPRDLLLDEPVSFDLPCTNEVDPVAYPSLYDPDSDDPNFSVLSDDDFYLFVTRYNWTHPDACQGTPGGTRDRDVVAYPVKLIRR